MRLGEILLECEVKSRVLHWGPLIGERALSVLFRDEGADRKTRVG